MPARKTNAATLKRQQALAEQCMDTADALALHRPRGWDRSFLFYFFVCSDGWQALPEYAGNISTEARYRGKAEGVIVPPECFNKTVDRSQGQTLRNYIKTVVFEAMRANGITPPTMDKVVTAVEDDGEGGSVVVIYRKQ